MFLHTYGTVWYVLDPRIRIRITDYDSDLRRPEFLFYFYFIRFCNTTGRGCSPVKGLGPGVQEWEPWLRQHPLINSLHTAHQE